MILRKLCGDQCINIIPAGKGNTAVVTGTKDYKEKKNHRLCDSKTESMVNSNVNNKSSNLNLRLVSNVNFLLTELKKRCFNYQMTI